MATKAAHGFSVFCRQDFIGADYGKFHLHAQCLAAFMLFQRLLARSFARPNGARRAARLLHADATARLLPQQDLDTADGFRRACGNGIQ
jgi:hypothetical protein